MAAADITLKFVLFPQIKYLQSKEYDVRAICSPGLWIEPLKKEGIVIQEIKIKRQIFTPFSDLVSLCRLFFYFRKEKFDAVFTFTPKPGLLGQLAARLAGVPIVFNTIFGFYFHENTPYLKRIFFVLVERLAARCSDFIFFWNNEDFITAKKERIITSYNARYIGDGINLARFNPEKFSQDFITKKKEALGIGKENVVIGIVARLVKEKGYVELFEAFKMVLVAFPKTILLIAGSSDLQKKDSINLDTIKQKNVIFLGERTDIDEIFALMDIFVLPSHREGFSHSIMEASAMGLPIIASDIRGCRKAIEPGVTGLLVPVKNSQKLAETIINLISHKEKAKNMGYQGAKKAKKEFDERLVFDKIEQQLNGMIAKKVIHEN